MQNCFIPIFHVSIIKLFQTTIYFASHSLLELRHQQTSNLIIVSRVQRVSVTLAIPSFKVTVTGIISPVQRAQALSSGISVSSRTSYDYFCRFIGRVIRR